MNFKLQQRYQTNEALAPRTFPERNNPEHNLHESGLAKQSQMKKYQKWELSPFPPHLALSLSPSPSWGRGESVSG